MADAPDDIHAKVITSIVREIFPERVPLVLAHMDGCDWGDPADDDFNEPIMCLTHGIELVPAITEEMMNDPEVEARLAGAMKQALLGAIDVATVMMLDMAAQAEMKRRRN